MVHQLKLLDAEHFALHKKPVDDTKMLYCEGVRLSIRAGFIQDAALTSERFAEYLLEVKDVDGASYQMGEAVRYYREWGALRKVSMLEEKYADTLLCAVDNTLKSSGTRLCEILDRKPHQEFRSAQTK